MLHSMTGFARQSAESALGTLTWELRAVNHRYLDVQFKLPDDLRPKEQAFRQQVGDRLKRGKVECAFHFRRAFDENEDILDDLEGRFRRSRAIRVAAHTLEYQQHRCVFSDDNGGSILVVRTVPQRGYFGVLDLHSVSFLLVSLYYAVPEL